MRWFVLSAAEMGSRVLIKNSAVVQRINPKPPALGSNPGCIFIQSETFVKLFSFPVLPFVKWAL